MTVPLVWGTRASLTAAPHDPDTLNSLSHRRQPGCHLRPCMVSSSTPPVSGGTTCAQGDEGPAHIMTTMLSATGEGSYPHWCQRDPTCGPSRPKQNKTNRHLPCGCGRGCQASKGQDRRDVCKLCHGQRAGAAVVHICRPVRSHLGKEIEGLPPLRCLPRFCPSRAHGSRKSSPKVKRCWRLRKTRNMGRYHTASTAQRDRVCSSAPSRGPRKGVQPMPVSQTQPSLSCRHSVIWKWWGRRP